jgi:MFS family permease
LSTTTGSLARQALQHPDFARYAFARFAATLAWQMLDAVLLYQVWHLTGSEALTGTVGLSQFIPFALLLLPGGQIADRYDRRSLIMLAYTLETLATGLLLAFTLSGGKEVYVCLVSAALLGVGRAFWAPAGQAMTPNLVPKDLLSGAIAVNSVLFQAGLIVGPLLGGVIAYLSIGIAYEAIIALLIVSILLMARVKSVRAEGGAQWHWGQVLEGARFVWNKKPLFGAISLDLFAVLFGGAVALLPVFADRILHVNGVGYGLLRAAPGMGAAIVAFFLGLKPITRHAGRWMFGGVAVFGVGTIIFGASTHYWLSFAMLAIVGAGDMVSVFVRGLLVQLETPDAIRGRVSAVNSLFIGSSNELGAFESGVTGQWLGAARAVMFGGIGTLIVVATYMRMFPALRKLDRFPDPVH